MTGWWNPRLLVKKRTFFGLPLSAAARTRDIDPEPIKAAPAAKSIWRRFKSIGNLSGM